jgi:hypothetical protein
VLHPRGEGHVAERPIEVPVLLRGVDVADDLDVARVTAAKPGVMGQPDELDRQRVDAHQPGGHCVDGHLVGTGQDDVLHVRHHAARSGTVAGEGAVHHREDAAVNLLLDHQQVDEGLVDDRMGPVAALVQQPAEGILHCPGRGGEDVGLDRWQVQDVLADEAARDHEPVRVDLIQAQELAGQVANGVLDVDPGLVALIEVDVLQTVGLDDGQLLVLAFTQVRVDDHGAVVAGVNPALVVAILQHGADDPVELPRRRRRPGEKEVPGDVDLERRVDVLGQHLLIVRQVQQ